MCRGLASPLTPGPKPRGSLCLIMAKNHICCVAIQLYSASITVTVQNLFHNT